MKEKKITIKEGNLKVCVVDHFGTEINTIIMWEDQIRRTVEFTEYKDKTYKELLDIAEAAMSKLR